MGKPIKFEGRLIFADINVLVFANPIKYSIYFEQKSYASSILDGKIWKILKIFRRFTNEPINYK